MTFALKSAFCEDRRSIRFSSTCIIHSKIFLLSNASEDTRVVIGSANFSSAALSNEIPQYEDIEIFDNDKKRFEHYLKRYDHLRSLTIDYISDDLKKSVRDDTELSEETIVGLQQVQIEKAFSTDAKKLVENASIEKDLEIDENYIIQVKEVFKTQTEVRNGKRRVSKNAAKKEKIKEIMLNRYRKSTTSVQESDEGLDRPAILFFDDSICMKFPDDEKVNPLERPSMQEISQGLANIGDFIRPYYERTMNGSIEEAINVYDILVYALSSPFIWKIREDALKPEAVPLFCYFHGSQNCGKSNLLYYINKLIFGVDNDQYVFLGDGRSSSGEKHQEKINKDVLDRLLKENDAAPILVDEITKNIFTNPHNSDWLKSLSNSRIGVGPVVICTSNFDKTLQEGVERRVKDLKMGSSFPIMSDENQEYFDKTLDACTNAVFREVSYRLLELVDAGTPLYKRGEDDFLYYTRSILKDFYMECDMEIPDYFADSPKNMRDRRGRRLWHNFYTMNPEAFKLDPADDDYVVVYIGDERNDRSELDRLLSNSFKVHGDSSKDYIHIQHTKEFFEWMNVPMDKRFKRKKGFFGLLN